MIPGMEQPEVPPSRQFEVEVQGPFAWLPSALQGDRWLFTAPERKQAGIYLWAVPYSGSSLVCWVGYTSRPFEKRFQEHTRSYLAGTYTILDHEALLAGRRVEWWHGMWTRAASMERVDDYLVRAGELAAKTRSLLQTFRIYLMPLEADKRILARIEAAMVGCLYRAAPEIADIMDKGYHLASRRADEEPGSITFRGGPDFHGIPRLLQI